MTSTGPELPAELERHLAGCPRCREMAEILSPVLDELHSVRRSLDSEEKPPAVREDWGVKLARRTAQDLTERSAQPSRRETPMTSVRSRIVLTALILLIGVAGGWGLSLLQSDQPASFASPAGVSLDGNHCTWLHPDLVQRSSPQTVSLTCMACHLPVDASH